MEEPIKSHDIEFNVVFEYEGHDDETGHVECINITELYAPDEPNLVDLDMDAVREDCERQLWMLKDKGRDL